MSDPRNVAHDKKVKQEKAHQPSPGGEKKRRRAPKSAAAREEEVSKQVPDPTPPEPGALEKSQTVLSKLKEMEFHSRANIETLASLTLTIEDELKQREFAGGIGEVYSAQDNFQTKVTALITSYEAKCESLKPT